MLLVRKQRHVGQWSPLLDLFVRRTVVHHVPVAVRGETSKNRADVSVRR